MYTNHDCDLEMFQRMDVCLLVLQNIYIFSRTVECIVLVYSCCSRSNLYHQDLPKCDILDNSCFDQYSPQRQLRGVIIAHLLYGCAKLARNSKYPNLCVKKMLHPTSLAVQYRIDTVMMTSHIQQSTSVCFITHYSLLITHCSYYTVD